MTRKTYCGNLLWQSGLTLLALLAPGGTLAHTSQPKAKARASGSKDGQGVRPRATFYMHHGREDGAARRRTGVNGSSNSRHSALNQ